jgi:hypothetical protein
MDINSIREKLKTYIKVDISLDLNSLPDHQKQVIEHLVAAGTIADEIFWQQSSHDAISIREQYKNQPGPIKDYIKINYGPYDRLNGFKRFIGKGPDQKPLGAGFYPEDLSRGEFSQYLIDYPENNNIFENLYTVILRSTDGLKSQFYHQVYKSEILQITRQLEKAAKITNNGTLRSYLLERAQALKTDQYYQSDLAWMNLKDNQIDIVIGPIENYEDLLFNFKTAYEAAVMVKDIPASEELAMYKKHLYNLEKNLPVEDKYKNPTMGSENILEIVNIAYFGGDFQAGVKTIAASLPNDEKVINEKGAKKQLYKNIMQAKFDRILLPIANLLISDNQKSLVSKNKFISQVILHEISHTIGPTYIVGGSKSVRKALQEKYSIIEECKADILGIYAVRYFDNVFSLAKTEIAEHYITYVAGLFRSIRFGINEAHGLANLIQLNFLLKWRVITREQYTEKYSVDIESIHQTVSQLAEKLLMIEALGDYNEALKFIDNYGNLTNETFDTIKKLNKIPTDLDLKFNLNL